MIEQVGFLIISTIVLTLLGLIVAFSPTIVITEITTLVKSKDPYRHSLALIAGLTTAIFFVTYVAVNYIDPTTKIDLPSLRPTKLSDIFDLILGAGLVALGIVGLRRISSYKPKEKLAKDRIFTVKKLYIFGLLKMLTSISSILAILVFAKFINTYILGNTERYIATALFLFASLAPFGYLAFIRYKRPQIFMAIETRTKFPVFYKWKKLIFIACISLGLLMVYSALK